MNYQLRNTQTIVNRIPVLSGFILSIVEVVERSSIVRDFLHHYDFVIDSSFVLRHSIFPLVANAGSRRPCLAVYTYSTGTAIRTRREEEPN